MEESEDEKSDDAELKSIHISFASPVVPMNESDMHDPQVSLVLAQGKRLRSRQYEVGAPEQETEFNTALARAVICFAAAMEMGPSETSNCFAISAMD